MICAMIGCSNRSDRDDVRFFRPPKVVTCRGEQMFSLTTERQLAWLKAISRDDISQEKLSNVFVCGSGTVEYKGIHILILCLYTLI